MYDLKIAARRPFRVAALAGIIVFGSRMRTMFMGQPFLQNVLGRLTGDAGFAILLAAVLMIRGARSDLMLGYILVLLGFVTMLLFWSESIP